MSRKPKRPYLLRALYDWIVDSDMTPYVLVDANAEDVAVPREYVQDGKIVLNLSPQAVRDFALDDSVLVCSSRFGGRPFALHLPLPSIQAIYARETGEGMIFDDEGETPTGPPAPAASTKPAGSTKPDDDPKPPGGSGGGHLKVVK